MLSNLSWSYTPPHISFTTAFSRYDTKLPSEPDELKKAVRIPGISFLSFGNLLFTLTFYITPFLLWSLKEICYFSTRVWIVFYWKARYNWRANTKDFSVLKHKFACDECISDEWSLKFGVLLSKEGKGYSTHINLLVSISTSSWFLSSIFKFKVN